MQTASVLVHCLLMSNYREETLSVIVNTHCGRAFAKGPTTGLSTPTPKRGSSPLYFFLRRLAFFAIFAMNRVQMGSKSCRTIFFSAHTMRIFTDSSGLQCYGGLLLDYLLDFFLEPNQVPQ